MKREGSPLTGLGAVVLKELADHLSSVRMFVLEILIFLTAVATVYAATQTLRTVVGEDPFVYLRIFTIPNKIGDAELPSFLGFMGFLMPLVGIALAFDSINGEYLRRTMSRVLAQPIYRDAVLMGKFLAGMATLATTLLAVWLLITGLGMLRLGVVPEAREVARGLVFLFVTLAYGGVWLGLALLFSVIYRQPATSALATISVWLFFLVFWEIVASLLFNIVGIFARGGPEAELSYLQLRQVLSWFSPNTLYTESAVALLTPEIRTLGPLLSVFLQAEAAGLIPRSQLPLSQSLLLAWPQLTGLVGTVIILFTYAYVRFQRQEVRA
ncbi:MAG: ABC transporter permease [Armatimonadetes bacterium RBG_16_67_12]|nr:MAG: ABC transporter permease [Armatimonadetes bacterium RBG_16_67_12]